MKNIVNNITNGKDLEVSFPQYFEKMMDNYCKNSYVRFTMNYYTYYDSFIEENVNKNEKLVKLFERFNRLVDSFVMEDKLVDGLLDAVREIDDIRNTVIADMKGITSVVDILNMYEYCLNRVEYRFKENDKYGKIKDEDFTRDVMRYIVSDEDKMVISMKICDVIRQLPVRMLKARFLEYVYEGMKVYKGSEKKTLDDFMYMLRTSSTIDVSSDAFSVSDDITEILEKLKGIDYKSITADEYNAMYELLNYAASYIEKTASDYMLFQELVNDLYVILLAIPYVDGAIEEKIICRKVIHGINDTEEDIEEYLMMLEGKQEKYTAFIEKYEYAYDVIENSFKDMIDSLMLSHQYNSLRLMEKLQSASIFIEFEEEEVEASKKEEVDEEYIEEMYKKFVEDYNMFASLNSKAFVRAAMANILSGLPVFFGNVSEIQDYVYNAMSGCSDNAEKIACKEILYSLMEE